MAIVAVLAAVVAVKMVRLAALEQLIKASLALPEHQRLAPRLAVVVVAPPKQVTPMVLPKAAMV